MTKLEHIRASHSSANRKIWTRLNTLKSNNKLLNWLWQGLARMIYGVVCLFGWLAFVDSLFRDVRFTLHFMEAEIDKLPPECVRAYLITKRQEYTRRLSYGSVSAREQKRIDNTFDYLFKKYPAPVVADVSASRHAQVMGGLSEVKTAVDSVASYTDRKDCEDVERQKREAEQLAAAEKRRERHRSWTGFEAHPTDFSPKLSDAQIAMLTDRMNEIGVFRRDVTPAEISRLLLCEHSEPLQVTHNKVIALILEQLSAEGLITPKWQRVAAEKNCFTSKQGKPLTAKDLSSAKQTAELIPGKKYEMILATIEAVKKAK